MKRTGMMIVALVVLLAGAALLVYSQSNRTEIFWTYASTQDPACGTATSNCIQEFPVAVDIGQLTTEKFVLPHTTVACPTPLPARPVNCADPSGIFYGVVAISSLGPLPYGTVNVSVRARGFDNNGQPISSVPSNTGFLNLPRPVVGLGTR